MKTKPFISFPKWTYPCTHLFQTKKLQTIFYHQTFGNHFHFNLFIQRVSVHHIAIIYKLL